MAEELIPIVQRAYDFAVDLYGAVDRFPRAQKPLLGRELVGPAVRLDVLGYVVYPKERGPCIQRPSSITSRPA